MGDKPAETRGLRRVPTQERSRRRLEQILHAAAVGFAEEGVEGLTVERIAEQAGTSVGSVYQFFPNKLAIFAAVADRCMQNVRAAFRALIGTNPANRGWRELLESVVDGLVALQRDDPYARAVWSNLHHYQEFEEADVRLEQELVAATQLLFAGYAPHLDPAKSSTIALLTVDIVSIALLNIPRRTQAVADALLDEAKVALQRYLTPYLEPDRPDREGD